MDSKTILIIDDVLQVRYNLKEYFSDFGYTIYEAGNGAQGLKYYNEHKPDLIIIDFELRDMNCFNFLGALRKFEKKSGGPEKTKIVPVIVISGVLNESEIKPLRDHLGIMGFMPKPLIMPKLVEMAVDILGKEYYAIEESSK